MSRGRPLGMTRPKCDPRSACAGAVCSSQRINASHSSSIPRSSSTTTSEQTANPTTPTPTTTKQDCTSALSYQADMGGTEGLVHDCYHAPGLLPPVPEAKPAASGAASGESSPQGDLLEQGGNVEHNILFVTGRFVEGGGPGRECPGSPSSLQGRLVNGASVRILPFHVPTGHNHLNTT